MYGATARDESIKGVKRQLEKPQCSQVDFYKVYAVSKCKKKKKKAIDFGLPLGSWTSASQINKTAATEHQ